MQTPAAPGGGIYARVRALASLGLMTMAGSGMYAIVVSLKPVAAELGATRGEASLAYTGLTIGFGVGGILVGRLTDRIGIFWPAVGGSFALSAGMLLAAEVDTLWQLIAVHALLIGMLGSGTFFAPLVADITHWFTRARGLAVGVVISGNYVAGVVWPPIVQHLIDAGSWRDAYHHAGIACLAVMLPLCLVLRRPTPHEARGSGAVQMGTARPLGVTPRTIQCLVCTAGVGCCVAMAMPQVHLVAHASDLGFAPARGAEMLALMLGGGVISRLGFGAISDRIGGIPTLVIGSAMQALSLVAFMFVDGLVGLFVMAALFGLSQGGIVPSYAIIIRTLLPPREAGARIGTAMMFTLLGMALGGWMAGAIYDITGSYRLAFINAIAFNVFNLAIALWLLARGRAAGAARA